MIVTQSPSLEASTSHSCESIRRGVYQYFRSLPARVKGRVFGNGSVEPSCPKDLKTVIESQGRVLEVKHEAGPIGKRKRRPRGCIKGLSKASAMRLVDAVNRIDWSEGIENDWVRFWTITCPLVLNATPEQMAWWLHVYKQALKRKFPRLSMIYVMERQKSGNPHYHIILYGMKIQKVHLIELRMLWERTLGWDWMKRGHHIQCKMVRVKSVQGLVRYLTSYVVKAAEKGEGQAGAAPAAPILDSGSYPHGECVEGSERGVKWWGFHNRSGFKVCEKLRVEGRKVTKAVVRMRRRVRSWLKARKRAGEYVSASWLNSLRSAEVRGFKIYTDCNYKWLECFALCCDDSG